MSREREHARIQPNHHVLTGGEMGARITDFDWSQTSLGPIDQWPQSLITVVRVLLNSRYPMFLWWGSDLINIYNDAYIPVLGARHPDSLGRPAPQIWSEIWDTIGPQSAAVMSEGCATWNESVPLMMERYGFTEETYFTFSYSPVPDSEGHVNGVFCACTEDTQRVIGERQLDLLRELAARTVDARTLADACELSMSGLATNPYDIPFAMLYLIEPDKQRVVRAGTSGIERDHAAAPAAAALDGPTPWPFAEVIAANQARLVSDIGSAFASLPTGMWDRPPHQAVVVPVALSGRMGQAGILVIGLNPFRLFDDNYQRFITLAAGQIAATLANALTYEEQHQRAEALAELDRAKTVFFSNISHEFRTPLTLMLGPAEDALADPAIDPMNRERFTVIHRNSQRLLKLVNALLDFSRIEAGRVDAYYEPTDLAALTADLTSVFRSSIERAGLKLIVSWPSHLEPVYVNPEMWEKIVFNLLSNAFKFTLEGQIEVRVRPAGEMVELTVRDTGLGIPAEEIPRLFERFHRVEGTQGRTIEGTGIGLALVQELTRLHGGTVSVESALDQGSIFTVAIPRGHAHLPAARIRAGHTRRSQALDGGAYVEELLRVLPSSMTGDQQPMTDHLLEPDVSFATDQRAQPVVRPHARIVLADDNADMREYVQRRLSPYYAVEAVADGVAALAAARAHVPDLVLTDVMMPRLDGFGLLRELRSDPCTRDVPVILLSARAGEEARVEGLEAGADDYLIKPFSVRELLARVDARLELARLRRESTRALRESEERLRLAVQAARMIAWEWDTVQNEIITTGSFTEIYGRPGVQSLEQGLQVVHPDDRERQLANLQAAVAYGEPYHIEFRAIRSDTSEIVWLEEWGFAASHDGEMARKLFGVTMDITKRKLAEEAIRRSEVEFRQLAASVPQLIWTARPTGEIDFLNEQWRDYTGMALSELHDSGWQRVVHPADLPRTIQVWTNGLHADQPLEVKHRLRHRSGQWRWQLVRAVPLKDPAGQIVRWFGSCTDIHEQEQAGRDMQFLSDLAEHIRLTEDTDELLASVAQMLGAYLQVTRCYFAEIDDLHDRWFIYRDYHSALPSIAGAYRISDFAADTVQTLRSGYMLVSEDTQHDPRSAASYADAYEPIDIRAHIIIPLLRDGQWVSNLVVAADTPRQWQQREVRLLETVAERIWLAIEKLRAEQALRESQARLHELYAQEQAAREHAEEASRLKDEFLATVSHELRTPLTAILGYGELIQIRKRDEAYIARSLEKIMRSAKSQAQLIEDLLDVSRIVTGKLRLNPQPMDLVTVIHSAIDAVRPALDAKLLDLNIDLDCQGGMINGDAGRLQQVVWNLLSNAVKFTPQGGTIEIRLRLDDSYTQLTVRDTGQGISPEFLPYVFDRFRQADSASTRSYGGLGLGLAIVRHVVEMHGGTVQVASDGADTGATFMVCLPRMVVNADTGAISSDTQPDDPAAWLCPPEIAGLRVLVVEDQPDILELIHDMLAQCGAVVRVSASSTAALAMLREWQPQVLVSDIAMPGEDGYWLIRNVRSLPPEAGGTIPAVALTAYVRLEDRTRVLATGFQMYIPKPVDRVELLNVVASLVRRA